MDTTPAPLAAPATRSRPCWSLPPALRCFECGEGELVVGERVACCTRCTLVLPVAAMP